MFRVQALVKSLGGIISQKNGIELDRRADERFEMCIPVSIGPICSPGMSGLVMNVSMTGAAVRIIAPGDAPRAWLARLDQGDELWITDLLAAPIPCFVVVFEDDILRVHFADAVDLSELIKNFAGHAVVQ